VSPLPFGDRLLGFSVAFPPSVPEVAARSWPPGRVWEGAPLPIKHVVSAANSFWGGLGELPNAKLSTDRTVCFVKKSVKRVLRKKNRP